MAVVGSESATLMDLARRLNADDKIAHIIEILNDTNGMLEDTMWLEGNLLTGHKTTIRTGLPQATWRKLNYGVPKAKSQTAQITDETGMLEVYAEVDKALVDLNENRNAFRLSEDRAFIEGMSQQVADTMIYGDPTISNAKFMGFTPRYDTPSTSDTDAGYNILNGGGAGADNTSLWLIGWGDRSMHGIFPKGSKSGLSLTDLGEHTLLDADGGQYQGLRTHYKWDAGLTVRDWRWAVRICNIDVSNLVSDTGAADLIRLMIRASERVPEGSGVRKAFYCNKTVRTFLRLQIINKSNVNLTFETVEGKKVMMFDDIPVRRTDAIINAETLVTGTFATE